MSLGDNILDDWWRHSTELCFLSWSWQTLSDVRIIFQSDMFSIIHQQYSAQDCNIVVTLNTHLNIPHSIVTTHQCLPTYKQLFNYASTTSYSWWIFFSSSLSCALCHEHKQCQIFFCVNCKDYYRVTVLHILHRKPFNSRNICWIKQFLNNKHKKCEDKVIRLTLLKLETLTKYYFTWLVTNINT